MGSGIDRSVPTIFWAPHEGPDEHPYPGLINGHCTDIDKSTVASLFKKTFGYDYVIDPRTCRSPYVRKSELNAAHDGMVLFEPSEPEPDFVYQRLFNNELGNGLVEDLRLIYMRGVLPFLYRKQRAVASRFANENTDVSIERTSSFVTEGELRKVELLSRAIGIDYGELDVVRDRNDNLLYVLDINRTPAGPPNGLPKEQSDMAVKEMAAAFKAAFSCVPPQAALTEESGYSPAASAVPGPKTMPKLSRLHATQSSTSGGCRLPDHCTDRETF
jgi:hypothetical protein